MDHRVWVLRKRVVRQGVAMALAALVTIAGGNRILVSATAPAGAGAAGSLTVTSDPAGAAVYVDGDFVGQTPVNVPDLSAGDHRVRVAKDGYLENGRIVGVDGGKAETLHVRLSARARAAQSAQKPAALKIVVVEGEDSVNIIDQKTAVAPVVEVRDSNDLPVANATVTFLLRSGGRRALLNNGVRQVTMTTNAAGRATVAVNPLSRGAIQIQVNAAYQGQAATATITQTNFATAAQAAQAANASSGAGGAGGGAGGGLSTTAIAGIAGAAAAGTIAAVKVAGGPPPCTFAVSPTSVNAGGGAGTATVNVTIAPLDCEPPTWSASSSASFISLSPSTGSGNGSVTLSVAANASGSGARTGTVTIAGQTVTVSQAAACTFSVSPTSLGPIIGAGGTATVNVAVSPGGCSPSTWTASSSASFLSVSPSSGNGSGSVTVTASANPQGAAQRSGNVIVAGQTVTVSQNQAFAPCNQQNVSGRDVPETRTIELGRRSGTFTFTYQTYGQPDRMVVSYEGRSLFDTGCVGASGAQNLSYSGNATTITVQVTPNCRGGSGTAWDFTVSCPR